MTGSEFRALRLSMGITQSAMADLFGLKLRRIQQLEVQPVITGPVAILAARLLTEIKRAVWLQVQQ